MFTFEKIEDNYAIEYGRRKKNWKFQANGNRQQ